VIPAEWVLPVLRGLAHASGESAAFHVRNGDYRVCLWRVQSTRLIRDHTQPGDIRPLDKGAGGKLLIAFAEPLDPKYAALRSRPISHSYGELEHDVAGIGVPVFGAAGEVRGVLTLSGPCSRFTPETVLPMEKHLWQAAEELTRRVGGDTRHFQDAAPAQKRNAAASAMSAGRR
jgi:DNA-binding IclR family transcriptional regulator